jgi:hypothetical protein
MANVATTALGERRGRECLERRALAIVRPRFLATVTLF